MAVAAIFFGVSQDSTIGDLSLIFIESMLGFIPMKFIQDFMKQYTPSQLEKKVSQTSLHDIDVDAAEKLGSMSDAELISTLILERNDEFKAKPENQDTIKASNEVEERVMRKLYKYPKCCKTGSKIIAICWTMMAAIIVTLFCIYFDVSLFGTNQVSAINHSQCPDTYYDIPEKIFIEYNLTQIAINDILSQPNYTPYNPPNSDNL